MKILDAAWTVTLNVLWFCFLFSVCFVAFTGVVSLFD